VEPSPLSPRPPLVYWASPGWWWWLWSNEWLAGETEGLGKNPGSNQRHRRESPATKSLSQGTANLMLVNTELKTHSLFFWWVNDALVSRLYSHMVIISFVMNWWGYGRRMSLLCGMSAGTEKSRPKLVTTAAGIRTNHLLKTRAERCLQTNLFGHSIQGRVTYLADMAGLWNLLSSVSQSSDIHSYIQFILSAPEM
jgi:hypothetical protein